jgi:hypothetical protein
MPRKTVAPNRSSIGDKNINSDVNNSNIVIGDNSSLVASASSIKNENLIVDVSQPIATRESVGSKLIPFLCYSKENSIGVREFRERLKGEDWIDPWFDEEDILPGQMWEGRVTDAVHNSHAVIVFLSAVAIRREGFFHKELKLALDAAAEKPDGTIFIIPIRLDACDVPERLMPYQYVDYFGDDEHKNYVYTSLIAALKIRAETLGIKI